MIDKPLWPFSVATAIGFIPVIVVAVVVVVALARRLAGWPPETIDREVFISAVLLSLIPLVLAFIDAVARRRGVLEFKGLKLDFTQVAIKAAASSSAIPPNIALPSTSVNDSSSREIIDSLRAATRRPVTTVDLEEGQAWWETRLLILLSGAARLGRPESLVFLATYQGRPSSFIGWGKPKDLLDAFLIAEPKYSNAVDRARAVASHWAQLEPDQPVNQSPSAVGQPPQPLALAFTAAQNARFDPPSGPAPQAKPNEYAQEQLLAIQLGQMFESNTQTLRVTISRLHELLDPALRTTHLQAESSDKERLRQIVEDDAEFIAVLRGHEFVGLVRKLWLLSTLVTSLVQDDRQPSSSR